jgi:hypothetical protein
MASQATIEIAKAVIAANEWASRSGTQTNPGLAAREALDATYRGDRDLRRFIELAMYWPYDCQQWAERILGK